MMVMADRKAQALPGSKKAKHDESVMATNNSSIVSKRSVERLYYPEPHFYKYFVKKPLRRAPLINRKSFIHLHVFTSYKRITFLQSMYISLSLFVAKEDMDTTDLNPDQALAR